MINHPKGLSVFSKGMLTFIFLIISFGAYAEDSVSFLGEESGISDRTIRSGELLSEYLEGVEDFCLSEEDKKGKKDKTVKKQAKCLKKLVKPLSKHKPTDISKSEKKILKNIIKAFKKNGGVIDPEPEVLLSIIDGRVTEPNGAVVASANISVVGSDATATTGEDGTFSLELEADKEYVLQLTATDFANQVSPVKSATEDGVVNLDLTMIARGGVQEFSEDDGGTLIGDNGASVTVEANSFVDAAGNPVTGDIQLTITPVDVSNAASLGAFPGEFTGTTDSGDTPIISFGTVEYVFTQNGNPVQLAPEVTADILIPIYIGTNQDGTAIEVGDIIPLWSLNEETGIWLQEGTGTVIASTSSPTGLAMQANVSHFTWWNCDVSMNAAQAIVNVNGSQAGTALIKATTTANIGGRSGTVDTVTNIGVPTSPLYIPSSVLVCFSADVNYVDGSSGTTAESCRTAAPNSTITVNLIAPVDGPLNVVANASEGPLSVNAVLGFQAIAPISIYPLTAESNVTYSVTSGTLPAGLSLSASSNNTQAVIAGLPTVAGDFSIVIEANNGTETDQVNIDFSIVDPTTSEAPVFVNDQIYLPLDFGLTQYDVNPYNVGGVSTNWRLEPMIDSPVPTWFEISSDGILSVTGELPGYDEWTGYVIAENAAGSAQTEIRVCTGDCSSTPTPIPGDYVLGFYRNIFTREGSSNVSRSVELNQPSPTDITFVYSTQVYLGHGSYDLAAADVDYVSVSATATIPAGEREVEIDLTFIDDMEEENTEVFSLVISNATGARIDESNSTTIVGITDDDDFICGECEVPQ